MAAVRAAVETAAAMGEEEMAMAAMVQSSELTVEPVCWDLINHPCWRSQTASAFPKTDEKRWQQCP